MWLKGLRIGWARPRSLGWKRLMTEAFVDAALGDEGLGDVGLDWLRRRRWRRSGAFLMLTAARLVLKVSRFRAWSTRLPRMRSVSSLALRGLPRCWRTWLVNAQMSTVRTPRYWAICLMALASQRGWSLPPSQLLTSAGGVGDTSLAGGGRGTVGGGGDDLRELLSGDALGLHRLAEFGAVDLHGWVP